jgi:hypothetical protein
MRRSRSLSPARVSAWLGECRNLLVRAARQVLEDQGGIVAARQAPARARELVLAVALGPAAQVDDRRHRGAPFLPGAEGGHLLRDQRLGLVDGAAARIGALLHHAAQVVDAVEEHVLERGDLALDVARDGEVDDEDGAPAPGP